MTKLVWFAPVTLTPAPLLSVVSEVCSAQPNEESRGGRFGRKNRHRMDHKIPAHNLMLLFRCSHRPHLCMWCGGDVFNIHIRNFIGRLGEEENRGKQP